jgi:aminoglycoside 3-N-acetyltransferase
VVVPVADGSRRRIGADAFTAALAATGAAPDDVVFVHSDTRRCGRVEGRLAEEKLDTVLRGLSDAVAGGVLLMPTFTYSFCRGEDFDVSTSASTVGALTERFRTRSGVRRTPEPIFSTAFQGSLPPEWEARLMEVGDKDCFGAESVFAYLAERDALLVFLDASFHACTFVHYIEQRLGVPYRYLKVFEGEVRAGSARRHVRASYLVRRLDQDVVTITLPLWDALVRAGHTRSVGIPHGPELRGVRARAVLEVAQREIARNPDFLLERGHRDGGRPHAA